MLISIYTSFKIPVTFFFSKCYTCFRSDQSTVASNAARTSDSAGHNSSTLLSTSVQDFSTCRHAEYHRSQHQLCGHGSTSLTTPSEPLGSPGHRSAHSTHRLKKTFTVGFVCCNVTCRNTTFVLINY